MLAHKIKIIIEKEKIAKSTRKYHFSINIQFLYHLSILNTYFISFYLYMKNITYYLIFTHLVQHFQIYIFHFFTIIPLFFTSLLHFFIHFNNKHPIFLSILFVNLSLIRNIPPLSNTQLFKKYILLSKRFKQNRGAPEKKSFFPNIPSAFTLKKIIKRKKFNPKNLES